MEDPEEVLVAEEEEDIVMLTTENDDDDDEDDDLTVLLSLAASAATAMDDTTPPDEDQEEKKEILKCHETLQEIYNIYNEYKSCLKALELDEEDALKENKHGVTRCCLLRALKGAKDVNCGGNNDGSTCHLPKVMWDNKSGYVQSYDFLTDQFDIVQDSTVVKVENLSAPFKYPVYPLRNIKMMTTMRMKQREKLVRNTH
eukprot:9054334-Ditylum_brightwellii.AAC.1